ncbi:FISUMP domain-containing protein [Fibrobacter sp.]|uniref:FISUMP domain-containing protein n=1 Tax=Fibrobacter sp. TaxID=35828 RepID=UPI00388D28E8
MDKIVKLSWSVLFVSLVLAFLACSDDSSSNTGLPEDESVESTENDKNVGENVGKDAGSKGGEETGVNGGKNASSKDGEETGVNGGKDAGSKDGEETGVNGDKDESGDATGVCGTETFDLETQRCGEGNVVETACGSGESAVWYIADGSKACEFGVVKGVCGAETYDLLTQRCGEGDVVETACGSGESAVWYVANGIKVCESGVVKGICGTETYDLETQRCGEGNVVETACGSGESAVWYIANGSKVCESGVVKGICGAETYDLVTQRCGEGDVVETACGSGETAVWYDSSKFFCDTRDNQLYGYVRIAQGNTAQIWMTKNLNYKTSSGSWCYSNNTANCTKYGRLYTWSAATGACPAGWRLPSTQNWRTLFDLVGGKSTAAKKLKSKSWNGTDNYGFSALPGGSYDGTRFNNAGSYAYFWTSTADNDRSAQSIDMSSYDSTTENSYVKSRGFSVRCLKK